MSIIIYNNTRTIKVTKCYFLLAEGQINCKMFSSHMAKRMGSSVLGYSGHIIWQNMICLLSSTLYMFLCIVKVSELDCCNFSFSFVVFRYHILFEDSALLKKQF